MIQKYTKVFIVCPGNAVTGGPECLHALGAQLIALGCDAYMSYQRADASESSNQTYSCPPPYKKYGVPHSPLVDGPDFAIIFPEIYTKKALTFKSSDVYIWWLSVDAYLTRYSPTFKDRFLSFFGRLPDNSAPLDSLRSIKHLAQSHYAVDFLESHGLEASYLSDYLSDEHLKARSVKSSRNDVILYNPAKGIQQTTQLIRTYRNYQFLPLIGMTSDQVHAAMLNAKLYIDFGHHPGKDKMPREAAIAGCCIVTNLKGSAKFDDVNIPQQYKLDDSKSNFIPEFGQLAERVLSKFDSCTQDFEGYRQIIRKEPQAFYDDVKRNFFK